MGSHFEPAFDLVGRPDAIQPAYAFYALFVVIGLGLLAVSIIMWRLKNSRRWWLLPFSVVWLGFTTTMAVADARAALQIRDAVRLGQFQTMEGCLAAFHPGSPSGSRSTAGDEVWSVNGQRFEYGQGEVRPAYHTVEGAGGAVHADTKVRVSFVFSSFYGGEEIVGLWVIPHACPFAPDTSPP